MVRVAEERGAIERPPRNLDDLADERIWVAWREENRRRKDGTKYPTKIPYDPRTRRQAEIPTNPSTWSTREDAKDRWEQLDDGGRGGIGIVLVILVMVII
jgi:primase-polymerase (primpol)-like protein